MPGRLLGFARSSPDSIKTKHAHPAPTSILPLYDSLPAVDVRPMEHLKRHSFHRHHSSDSKKSLKAEVQKSASIDFLVESPPLVFFNGAQSSTGALFSGQLKLSVTAEEASFKSLEVKFVCSVTHKKPVVMNCPECTTQTTELKKWDIISSKTLERGEYAYPISYLLAGHLPATTHGTIVVLDYYLVAEALTSTGETITFTRNIDVKRAIFPQGDKNSTRIFPPTDIVANATMPSLIHPIGEFPVQLRLSGLVVQGRTPTAQVRWKLRKLNWQIEEHQKMIAPACSKHSTKVGGQGKGVLHEDTRVLASEDIRQGWKSDITGGTMEIEFQAAINPALNPICDVDAPNGLEVTHHIVVEMVVSEEWAPLNRLDCGTPTGSARVLRAQFRVPVTERCGMGISWDEEQPPMYEDVPVSPPHYTSIEEYNISDLELDRLSIGS